MEEEWKGIVDYEGCYQVSNLGRVKSLPRKWRLKEIVIKSSPNTVGYLIVNLYKDGKRKSFLVHRLVLQSFNPTNSEMEVNHKDLNIVNNVLSNLEWCTPKENSDHYWNTADKEKRLPTPSGESHHLSRLDAAKVKEIRRLWEENIISNKSEIARMFGVADGTIRQILNKVTWKDI